MDMTTKARIKTLRDYQDNGADDLIDLVIAGVSAKFAALLGRHVLDTDYTETYELLKAGKVVWLRGYPVDSIDAITYTETPDNTDASDLTVNEDYYLDGEAGILRLRITPTPYDPGYVVITYNGGMATTTTTFITEWPEIAAACDQQVTYELNRRTSPGGNILTRDGKTEFGQPEVNILRGVREVLHLFARTVI